MSYFPYNFQMHIISNSTFTKISKKNSAQNSKWISELCDYSNETQVNIIKLNFIKIKYNKK